MLLFSLLIGVPYIAALPPHENNYYDISMRANYESTGMPTDASIEITMTFANKLYKRVAYGGRSLVVQVDLSSLDVQMALDNGPSILFAKHAWPQNPRQIDSPNIPGKKRDERKLFGVECFAVRHRRGSFESVLWRRISDPTDALAFFSYHDNKLTSSTTRILRRPALAGDITQFALPRGAKKVTTDKQGIKALYFQFILLPQDD